MTDRTTLWIRSFIIYGCSESRRHMQMNRMFADLQAPLPEKFGPNTDRDYLIAYLRLRDVTWAAIGACLRQIGHPLSIGAIRAAATRGAKLHNKPVPHRRPGRPPKKQSAKFGRT